MRESIHALRCDFLRVGTRQCVLYIGRLSSVKRLKSRQQGPLPCSVLLVPRFQSESESCSFKLTGGRIFWRHPFSSPPGGRRLWRSHSNSSLERNTAALTKQIGAMNLKIRTPFIASTCSQREGGREREGEGERERKEGACDL